MVGQWSQDVYQKAYKFAAMAHWNDQYKQFVPGTNVPYLMHFSFVAMEVIAALAQETVPNGDLAVQCALLHDTLEDTQTTFDELVTEFGQSVADGVLALSKNEEIGVGLSKTDRKKTQMADSLSRIKAQPKEVWMVKLADRITNLQPPPHYWTTEKMALYREEAGMIYDALKDGSRFLASRLREKIDGYPPE